MNPKERLTKSKENWRQNHQTLIQNSALKLEKESSSTNWTGFMTIQAIVDTYIALERHVESKLESTDGQDNDALAEQL